MYVTRNLQQALIDFMIYQLTAELSQADWMKVATWPHSITILSPSLATKSVWRQKLTVSDHRPVPHSWSNHFKSNEITEHTAHSHSNYGHDMSVLLFLSAAICWFSSTNPASTCRLHRKMFCRSHFLFSLVWLYRQKWTNLTIIIIINNTW